MRLNIVVVDDETPICQWLLYCIERTPEKHHVVSASNGSEAFQKIMNEKPDLVITDIRMPGMDGLELMRRTVEVLPFTVFVILTNYAEFSYAQEAVSLGAKEYLLKSELRVSDITRLVGEVSALKESKVNGKVKDVYLSGCIDLYNYYHMQEQPNFADTFWRMQGMADQIPYRLLCVAATDSPEEWHRVAQFSKTVSEQCGIYAVIACDKGQDYAVLQTDQEMSGLIARFEQALCLRGKIGISSVFYRRSEFPLALREASTARLGNFFSGAETTVYFEELQKRQPLNREALLEQRQEILELTAQRRYPEAGEQLELWFRNIGVPGAGDVEWAVDCCRRMVLSLEERYYQETEESEQTMVISQSMDQCIQRSREFLAGISSSYLGRCSSSISEALEYIHQHYMENLSLAEVAQQVYRSPGYFSRQFKEEVGQNFNVYLTLYRLDRAQELLRTTDLRVGTIAERVGYTSAGYFTRMYKRYKGVSPELDRMSKYSHKTS